MDVGKLFAKNFMARTARTDWIFTKNKQHCFEHFFFAHAVCIPAFVVPLLLHIISIKQAKQQTSKKQRLHTQKNRKITSTQRTKRAKKTQTGLLEFCLLISMILAARSCVRWPSRVVATARAIDDKLKAPFLARFRCNWPRGGRPFVVFGFFFAWNFLWAFLISMRHCISSAFSSFSLCPLKNFENMLAELVELLKNSQNRCVRAKIKKKKLNPPGLWRLWKDWSCE